MFLRNNCYEEYILDMTVAWALFSLIPPNSQEMETISLKLRKQKIAFQL